MVELDYLVIGHITQDVQAGSCTIGGTATYAARTAQALGCRVGVVTSADPNLDLSEPLSDSLVVRYLSSTTTTFENTYSGERRQQMVHGVAETLEPSMVPREWRAAIVHIGPVAQECDPTLVGAFRGAMVGVTPQGWMRQWHDDGRVSRCGWEGAEAVLAQSDAVVLSEEDIEGDRTLVAEYAGKTPLLVLTQGAAGCTVYGEGTVRRFPAPEVDEVDSTGAGDIFAASFFHALLGTRDPWAAARFANCLAAQSVTRAGLSATPDTKAVARCRRAAWGDEVGHAHHLRAG